MLTACYDGVYDWGVSLIDKEMCWKVYNKVCDRYVMIACMIGNVECGFTVVLI